MKSFYTMPLKIGAILLLFVVMSGGVKANDPLFAPTTTHNVEPYGTDSPNPGQVLLNQCPAGTQYFTDQFNDLVPSDDPQQTTLYVDSNLYPGSTVAVTISILYYEDRTFDFEVEGGFMHLMGVKSQTGLIYQWDPPVAGATNVAAVDMDTRLHASYNNDGGSYQDVSHLEFCLSPKEIEPLEASKTASGTYDRTVTWTLDKSVDTPSHSGEPGDSFNSIWTVEADKSESYDNYDVTGVISVSNPNNVAIDYSVSDTLSDGTIGTVDCDPVAVGDQASGTLDPFATIECSYTASSNYTGQPSGAPDMNTAVVSATYLGSDVGATAEAAIGYSEQLIGYDSGTLVDDRFSYSQSISDDTTENFPETFTCPTDLSLYEDGEYSYQEINVAKLNGNLNLQDSATVDVSCSFDALMPSKTAVGTYDRTVDWTLDKSVDVTSLTGMPGKVFDPVTWTVVVDKSETLGNYNVSGTIAIQNPSSVSQDFTVSDQMDDGTVANVSCPTTTVAAGATVNCTYSASLGDSPDPLPTLNTVTVSSAGQSDQTAMANVNFSEDQLFGYDSGTLYDERFGYSQEVNDDFTVTFEEVFECDSAGYSVTNIAVLNGNINLQDDATVDVVCEAPQLPSLELLDIDIDGPITKSTSSFTGSFDIQNASGGDTTRVMLGTTWVEVKHNHKGDFSPVGTCELMAGPGGEPPTATGDILDPHEIKTYLFSCDVDLSSVKNEIHIEVYVDGETTFNQINENRPDKDWFYRESFKLSK